MENITVIVKGVVNELATHVNNRMHELNGVIEKLKKKYIGPHKWQGWRNYPQPPWANTPWLALAEITLIHKGTVAIDLFLMAVVTGKIVGIHHNGLVLYFYGVSELNRYGWSLVFEGVVWVTENYYIACFYRKKRFLNNLSSEGRSCN